MSDVLARAKENYQRDKDHWEEVYRKAKEDMKFISDDEDAQWDPADRKIREKRPCLTIDQLGQFIHQVANTIRMNTPTINVIPGNEADIETADIFKGLIKNIEYRSNADEAYDTASLSSIRCSIGFIFIDHDYVNNNGFEQELLIKRSINPLQCWIDCDSIEADGSDARRGIKIQAISVKEFRRRYPEKEVSSFGEDKNGSYKEDDSVNIAEYFEMADESKEVGLSELGEMEEVVKGVQYSATRTLKKSKVMRYILSGAEELAATSFPGKYIPIVPVYGEEAWIDGKRQLYSLIRKSKDAQKMYNYWKSLETELLMKQPNAPIMAGAGQVENYAADWQNPGKAMVLRYETHDADGNVMPAPQRLAPPTIPTGIVNAARATVDDIKATMGIYNASLGEASNETSGIAISRRKEEGDVATYHFGDNLVRSITHVGRVLVCAIPEVYDTGRIIQITGMEDEPKQVGVNGVMAPEQERPFDLRKGEYSVRVITGASNLTKRQEAAEFFGEVVKSQPELINVMGDLLFKNMDIAGGQEMAERMKKVIDPKFLDDDKGLDPEKEQLKAALQEAQMMMQQMQEQVQVAAKEAQDEIANMQLEIANKEKEILLKGVSEENKQKLETQKLKLEILKMQLERKKIDEATRMKEMELALKAKELDMKEAVEIEKLNMEHENAEREEMRLNSQQEESEQSYEG